MIYCDLRLTALSFSLGHIMKPNVFLLLKAYTFHFELVYRNLPCHHCSRSVPQNKCYTHITSADVVRALESPFEFYTVLINGYLLQVTYSTHALLYCNIDLRQTLSPSKSVVDDQESILGPYY